jgi:hypothetical protein
MAIMAPVDPEARLSIEGNFPLTFGSPGWPGADLFTAFRGSLGLRLERRNVQVQFLLIDHIERIPTED